VSDFAPVLPKTLKSTLNWSINNSSMPATQGAASASNPLKRKRPSQHEHTDRKRRTKPHEARAIAAQTKDKAYGDGELNVDKFVKARAFEIQALEDGMNRSKKLLSQRAFQSVPRDLRRRTASHNVKRVPKRLRARAAKEVEPDGRYP
jgi:ribonuclease P/MRP protein subunit POP1